MCAGGAGGGKKGGEEWNGAEERRGEYKNRKGRSWLESNFAGMSDNTAMGRYDSSCVGGVQGMLGFNMVFARSSSDIRGQGMSAISKLLTSDRERRDACPFTEELFL